MDNGGSLHVVMLPWLAMGHLLPFLELSKRLAGKGHRVSYLTTPRNADRLRPNIPSNLSPLLHLVELPLPTVEHLPCTAEATLDLPSDHLRPYLRVAYDALQHHLPALLRRSPPPDWIIYDYAAHWLPALAARHRIPCAYLGLFNAPTLAFNGPTRALRGEGGARTEPDHFTVVPDWVPFPSTIAYRPHEARQLFEPGVVPDASGVSEAYRFAVAIEGAALVAVRSCREIELDWINLLGELYQKPVVPVGLFPPSHHGHDQSDTWSSTHQWLDKREPGSVVYVAFGSEVKLTVSQVTEIALGLERSGLPFLWALMADGLPDGFEVRTAARGVVCKGWVPQVRFLAHRAVGGFLTHGGWNSVVEALSVGVAMVLLPLVFDQGLNARHMVEMGVGVEVERDEVDGSFDGDGIARSLRLVMVEEDGKRCRERARECTEVFGDDDLQDKYVDDFVTYLSDHRLGLGSSEAQQIFGLGLGLGP